MMSRNWLRKRVAAVFLSVCLPACSGGQGFDDGVDQLGGKRDASVLTARTTASASALFGPDASPQDSALDAQPSLTEPDAGSGDADLSGMPTVSTGPSASSNTLTDAGPLPFGCTTPYANTYLRLFGRDDLPYEVGSDSYLSNDDGSILIDLEPVPGELNLLRGFADQGTYRLTAFNDDLGDISPRGYGEFDAEVTLDGTCTEQAVHGQVACNAILIPGPYFTLFDTMSQRFICDAEVTAHADGEERRLTKLLDGETDGGVPVFDFDSIRPDAGNPDSGSYSSCVYEITRYQDAIITVSRGEQEISVPLGIGNGGSPHCPIHDTGYVQLDVEL